MPFYTQGWEIFRYYDYWFKVTLLTLPGAVVAFQLKRKNWISVLVLLVATGYLAYASTNYFRAAMANFPNHLLSSIFALGLAIFFVFVLLNKKKHHIVAHSLIIVVLIVSVFLTRPDNIVEIILDEESWTYTIEDESVVVLEIRDGHHVTLTAKHDGHTFIRFENSEGKEVNYYVTVSGGSIWINLLDES